MQILDNIICTPYDPGQGAEFDPDWRRKVAVAWAENRWFPPCHIYYDPYIKHYREYVRLLNSAGKHKIKRLPERYRDIQDAETWYSGGNGNSAIKQALEALLLSGVELEFLVEDIMPLTTYGTSKEAVAKAKSRALAAVKLYDRVFFNIRDDKWLVNSSITTRMHFALGGAEMNTHTPRAQLLKVVGASYGYTLLCMALRNSQQAHGKQHSAAYAVRCMQSEVQINMTMRLLKNDWNNFDSTMLFGKNIEHQKMEFDTKASSGESDRYKDLAMKILEVTRPKLLAATMSVDAIMASNQSSMEQFEARKKVNSHAVADAGIEGAVKEWGTTVRANFDSQK